MRGIEDERLTIHIAPENQGTRTFYEISRLASGEIVTWLSDEDSFQFSELDYILDRFRREPECHVMFGGIIVGPSARKVTFSEATVTDTVQACITALSFSGCGGLFVRRSALPHANSFDVQDMDDAYALWNYYPVGFFASRCLARTMATTSRVVVVQSRAARTTNNWSKQAASGSIRPPHYYPASVADRLASSIVNVCAKSLPWTIKARTVGRLVVIFLWQSNIFYSPAFHDLLRENYPEPTLRAFLEHVQALGLHTRIGRCRWLLRTLLMLPFRLIQVQRQWRRLHRF